MKKYSKVLAQYLLTITFFIFIISTTLLGLRIADMDADKQESEPQEEALIVERYYENLLVFNGRDNRICALGAEKWIKK